MTYRLGVDVGGTFTDLLLIDEDTGATYRAKTPSTPADQSVGVLVGIDKVCAARRDRAAAIDQVLHGTTVATNAVLEGKGAKVGLVATEGYRQVLQIARSFVPGGLAGWIIWPKPEPLAALENTVEAVERVGARRRRWSPRSTRTTCVPKLKYAARAGRRRHHDLADQLLRQRRARAAHRARSPPRSSPASRSRSPAMSCPRSASTSGR